MTGAPLFAARIWYEPAPAGSGLGGHRTVIEFSNRLVPRVEGTTAVKAADLIQQCADHVAVAIREHTSSWHMLQRVFVDDLDAPAASSDAAGAQTSAQPAQPTTGRTT
jgi:KDO2-lipid IV(A) lauroyltransferase